MAFAAEVGLDYRHAIRFDGILKVAGRLARPCSDIAEIDFEAVLVNLPLPSGPCTSNSKQKSCAGKRVEERDHSW
jgi:hypothetical protein